MTASEQPAYVPFYRDTLEALANLDAEDVKAYVTAVLDYAYKGEEPGCSGPAMAVFVMGRYQLDQSMNRAATNRKNARGKRKKSEKVATEKPDASETVANDERTGSETEATGEPETSESPAKRDIFQDTSTKLQVTGSKTKDSGSKDQGPSTQVLGKPACAQKPKVERKRFKPPSPDEWWDQWSLKCGEYGVPPNRIEADQGFAFYDANGWKQANGNPVKRWRSCVVTCLFKAHPELNSKARSESGNDRFSDAARYDESAIVGDASRLF